MSVLLTRRKFVIGSSAVMLGALAAHVIHHANQHSDVGWYIKEKSIREAFGRVLAANEHIVASVAGHAHCGMRGWNDTAHGIHEVILPCGLPTGFWLMV